MFNINNTPLVSIVIPVYNGSNYVDSAIESCLNQTYPMIEIIIVNDGSNDNGRTKEAILKYGTRVKYFEKENGGVASALNLAIRQASGQYISWLSHDDVYDLSKIEIQVNELKKYNDPKLIMYSDFLVINSEGQTVGYQPCPRITPEQFRVSLLMGSFLHGCSLLMPKTVFDDYGYFDENLKTTQDYKFWFQISKTYKFAQVPEYLVHSRWHADQGVNKSKSIHIRECNELYLWAPTVFSWDELQAFGFFSKSDFYFKYAKRCKGDGFKKAFSYYYLKAILTANPRDLILAVFKIMKRALVNIKKSLFN